MKKKLIYFLGIGLILLIFADFLIFNANPLLIIYQDKAYFPFIFQYSYNDFNLNSNILVSYHSLDFLIIKQEAFLWINTPFNFDAKTIHQAFLSPSLKHFLGTGALGQDILATILASLKYLIITSFIISFLSTSFAIIFGSLQGYYRGKTDIILQRIYEVFLGIPFIYIILLLSNIIKISIIGYIILLALFNWMVLVPYVRIQVLQLKESSYIKSLEILSLKWYIIIFKHIFINVVFKIKPLIIMMMITISGIIVGLEFLQIPIFNFSLGNLIDEGKDYLEYPWIIISSSLFFIMMIVIFLLLIDFKKVLDEDN